MKYILVTTTRTATERVIVALDDNEENSVAEAKAIEHQIPALDLINLDSTLVSSSELTTDEQIVSAVAGTYLDEHTITKIKEKLEIGSNKRDPS